MTYSIVYSSQTGNTALLAQHLQKALPQNSLLYNGKPEDTAQKADLLFIGFWTDKGSSDPVSTEFLKTLRGKRIFLFGTAGFGGSETYFTQILARVAANLDSSNTVIGSYMCQGKMPISVRQRYEAMQAQQPEKAKSMLENFDRALTHPDETDLKLLEKAALESIR